VLDPDSALYRFEPQVVWLFTTFRDVPVDIVPGADAAAVRGAVDREIGRMAALWGPLIERAGSLVIQNNADIPADDPFGHLSGAAAWGRRTALRLYNALLPAAVPTGVIVFDLDEVAARYGRARWIDPRYWFHSKHACAPDAIGPLAATGARVIAGALGLSRKALVLDLDNTLWGGVIGDDGLAGITLGNGAAGEAFVAFQRHILELKRRGIILTVSSKNDPEVARAPFRGHPDMVLRLDDIAVFRANWSNKADNIRDIAATLGLGLDAMMLVDDNPMERDLVRRHLPMVTVIDLPADPAFYIDAMVRAGCFEAVSYSREDADRPRYYADNARRAELRSEAVDMPSYLASLAMVATVGHADPLSLPRIVQLVNKSNQFHLTGTRLTEAGLIALQGSPEIEVLHFRLRDRFGDNGLIAAIILRGEGDALHIDTWVMSCRVLGRSMEEFIMNEIQRSATDRGCRRLFGRYVPSARNGLVAGLYERLGFQAENGDGEVRMWSKRITRPPDTWLTHVDRAVGSAPAIPPGVS
jgi:FkbH-like protein